MRYSKLFIPEPPPASAEGPTPAGLLARGGYVLDGALLPLMVRVVHRIVHIVRQEMNRAGALEVLLPAGAQVPDGGARFLLYQIATVQQDSSVSVDVTATATATATVPLQDILSRILRRCGLDCSPTESDGGLDYRIAGILAGRLTPTQGTLGVTRAAEAAVARHHDAAGPRWPISIAPFHAIVLPSSPAERDAARRLYDDLVVKGVDVLLDDRDAAPAALQRDADRIGVPVQVVVSGGAERLARVRRRDTGGETTVPLDEAAAHVTALVQREVEMSLAERP